MKNKDCGTQNINEIVTDWIDKKEYDDLALWMYISGYGHIDAHADVPPMDGEKEINKFQNFTIKEKEDELLLIEGMPKKTKIIEDDKKVTTYDFDDICRARVKKNEKD